MGLNTTSRTPANGAVLTAGSQTLGIAYNITGGDFAYEVKFFWRKLPGGTWQTSSNAGNYTGICSFSQTVNLQYDSSIEWYVVTYWVDAGGTYRVASYTPWTFYAAPDTTAPTITSVMPAEGDVAPGGSGVTFEATLADNYQLASGSLYIDGVLEQTWTTAGVKTMVKALTLGAHTYRWTAEDVAGNTATTGTVNITVINGAPVVPTGTITVAGQTGPVEVANLGNIALSWPAFLDGNPEDTLTYTLENRAAGGAWVEVAAGITSPAYEWSPAIGLGAAELRVKASDGTTDSAYLTRTGITIVSSQSPNAPTLTSPTGGETWREGETHDVTWTPAATEHPEGLPCTYEIQFSALGDFSDAVTITTTADDGTYPWTLSTDLV